MAVTPKTNESFYREVDEELRRDQLSGFWKRYGLLVIAGIVLLLGAVGGYLYWQQQKQQRAERHAELLTAAFDDIEAGKVTTATPRLDQLAKEGAPGYRAAALLTKADLAVQANNAAAAIAGYKAVAANAELAAPYRELALIRQTAMEFDTLPPATVIERLKGLAVAGNPWFGSAGEMVAVAYLKQQKPQLAAPIFAAMAKDEKLPGSIRSRAVQMAGSLGLDAVQGPVGPVANSTAPGATKEATQ